MPKRIVQCRDCCFNFYVIEEHNIVKCPSCGDVYKKDPETGEYVLVVGCKNT